MKKKVDNSKKIKAVILLFAHMAEYLNEGKIKIKDEKIRMVF